MFVRRIMAARAKSFVENNDSAGETQELDSSSDSSTSYRTVDKRKKRKKPMRPHVAEFFQTPHK